MRLRGCSTSINSITVLVLFLSVCWTAKSHVEEAVAGAQTPAHLADGKGDIHLFYDVGYGNVVYDGAYHEWSHFPPSRGADKSDSAQNQATAGGNPRFPAPVRIPSTFYPAEGCYSSADPDIIRIHLEHIDTLSADGEGRKVLVVGGWRGQGKQTAPRNEALSLLVTAIEESHPDIKIAFHLQPYPGRSVSSIRADVAYLMRLYGDSSAIYRGIQGKPLFYVYDSERIEVADWAELLTPEGVCVETWGKVACV